MIATKLTAPVSEKDITSKLAALVRPATFAAGSLWVAHYVLQLGFGLATGKVLFEATGTALWRLDVLAFFGAYVATGVSLIGLSARFLNRAGHASIAGALSALVPVVAGAVGGVAGVFAPEASEAVFSVAGKTILFLFLSSLILGIAGLGRPGVMPKALALPVLLFGLLTLPLGLVLAAWEHTVPPYLVMELHFVFSGAAWLFVAVKDRMTA